LISPWSGDFFASGRSFLPDICRPVLDKGWQGRLPPCSTYRGLAKEISKKSMLALLTRKAKRISDGLGCREMA
jgi:hypothetical protein